MSNIMRIGQNVYIYALFYAWDVIYITCTHTTIFYNWWKAMNGTVQYDLRSTRLEYVSEMRYIDVAILTLELPMKLNYV